MTLEAAEVIAFLSAELKAARERIAELEAAVAGRASAPEALAELTHDDLIALPAQKRDICRTLVRAYPRPLNLEQLCARILCRDHARPPGPIGVKVSIFNLRQKLGAGAIVTVPGRGYMAGAPLLAAYGRTPPPA